MKKLITVLSYLTTAMAACAVTLLVTIGKTPGYSKLDQVEYLIQNRFIEEADMEKAKDAAATAMIDSLGDRWSYYLSAADYATHKEQVENAYVGIGITISPEENSQGFLILAVQKDSGAEAAGLLTGDIITSAESQDVRGMTTAQLRDIIRGKEGTSVSLEITRDSEVLRVQVTRMQILTEVVRYEMLGNSIGLIAISNFDARCADETIAAIEALREQGAQALIFDVRNNPGGYATELVKVLDYLLPEGDLFRTLDYAGRETVDKSDASFLDMPIAVVCNEDSYSAAEFFPAAIQEYGAGTIVGMPTCGKGYFQYTYELSDGSAVGLSAGKYFTPSGKSLIGTGIQPDVVVEVDDETRAKIAYGTLDAKDDPQIQAAADILTK